MPSDSVYLFVVYMSVKVYDLRVARPTLSSGSTQPSCTRACRVGPAVIWSDIVICEVCILIDRIEVSSKGVA